MLSQETWGPESFVLVALMVLYGLLLIVVVAIATSVYVPRTPRTGSYLIYYADISTMPFESFREQAGRLRRN